MRLGARGVVLKESAIDLLVKCIHRVHAGEIWLDPHMAAEVINAFSVSPKSGARSEKRLLSDREMEVVQLVAGFSECGQPEPRSPKEAQHSAWTRHVWLCLDDFLNSFDVNQAFGHIECAGDFYCHPFIATHLLGAVEDVLRLSG